MCSNYPGIKLDSALWTQEDKTEHLSSYAHVVNTIAKQVTSECQEMKNARAKRAKILFFIVKYAICWVFVAVVVVVAKAP